MVLVPKEWGMWGDRGVTGWQRMPPTLLLCNASLVTQKNPAVDGSGLSGGWHRPLRPRLSRLGALITPWP